jgi:hypothetical protein
MIPKLHVYVVLVGLAYILQSGSKLIKVSVSISPAIIILLFINSSIFIKYYSIFIYVIKSPAEQICLARYRLPYSNAFNN